MKLSTLVKIAKEHGFVWYRISYDNDIMMRHPASGATISVNKSYNKEKFIKKLNYQISATIEGAKEDIEYRRIQVAKQRRRAMRVIQGELPWWKSSHCVANLKIVA